MTPAELLRGIRTAAHHVGGIRLLRLFEVRAAPFAALRDEVEALCREAHPSDGTAPGHVTGWTRPFGDVLQFSLLNRSGRTDDFSADHDQSCAGKAFHAAARYPALAGVLAALPHAVNARINVLGPRSGLGAHEEHVAIRLRDGAIGARVRFHLPIASDADAELVLDGDVHYLAVGSVYFVNHGCVHAATNRGDTVRIHLAWDQLLTPAAFDAMFGAPGLPADRFARVPDAERVPPPRRHAPIVAYERMPPNVTPAELAQLALCAPQ